MQTLTDLSCRKFGDPPSKGIGGHCGIRVQNARSSGRIQLCFDVAQLAKSLNIEAAHMRSEEEPRPALLCTHQGRIPRMNIRTEGLCQKWVSVIPHEDCAEVLGGRVYGRPVSHDNAWNPIAGTKKTCVAFGVRLSGIHPNGVDVSQRCERVSHLVEISIVRCNDDRAVTRRVHGNREPCH